MPEIYTQYSNIVVVNTGENTDPTELAPWPYGPITAIYTGGSIYVACPTLPEAGYNQEYNLVEFVLSHFADFSDEVGKHTYNLPAPDSFVPNRTEHYQTAFNGVQAGTVFFVRARAYKEV